jgi:phosphatidylglycerophosphatase A
MPVEKESSDTLNQPVVTPVLPKSPPKGRSFRDLLALALATWGVGFIPLAPGTWGSVVGLGIFLVFQRLCADAGRFFSDSGVNPRSIESLRTALYLTIIVLVTITGTWAASRCEALFKKKDPGVVVADEVAGQLITFVFVPLAAGWTILAGFIAFRLFDIWKPFPIRRLESLGGGLGVMADDVLAGIYAAVLVMFVVTIHSFMSL